MRFPKLGNHLTIHLETGPASKSAICFTSKNRKVTVSSDYTRALFEVLLPLLTGQHSIHDITRSCSATLPEDVIHEFVEVLQKRHLLYDAHELNVESGLPGRYHALLSCFLEAQLDARAVLDKIRSSYVVVFGLQGATSFAAWSLAAAGIGRLSLIDSGRIEPADLCTAPLFVSRELGLPRQDVLAKKIAEAYPDIVVTHGGADDLPQRIVRKTAEGADLVLVCLATFGAGVVAELDDTLRQLDLPWILCSVGSLEGVVGPTFRPPYTPCYSCYCARSIGGMEGSDYRPTPERGDVSLASGQEGLPPGHAIIGNLLALKSLGALLDGGESLPTGVIHIVDFRTLEITKHAVLRQPWCPVCSPSVPRNANG